MNSPATTKYLLGLLCQARGAGKRRRDDNSNRAFSFNPLRVLSVIIVITIPLAGNAQVDQNALSQGTQVSPSTPTAQPGQRYRIGAGDVLDIRILNRPQLSREAVRVEGDGMI